MNPGSLVAIVDHVSTLQEAVAMLPILLTVFVCVYHLFSQQIGHFMDSRRLLHSIARHSATRLAEYAGPLALGEVLTAMEAHAAPHLTAPRFIFSLYTVYLVDCFWLAFTSAIGPHFTGPRTIQCG